MPLKPGPGEEGHLSFRGRILRRGKWPVAAFLLLFAQSLFLVLAGNGHAAPPSVLIRWYGHAFVYLIASSGIRIAIDPFGDETVHYRFPASLQADVVLISNEANDRSAGERIQGTPQLFRSVAALGTNNARGLLFRGILCFRDKSQGAIHGHNTAFVFELDGMRFAHLGDLGHPLSPELLAEFGKVDVLFLPVGRDSLLVSELDKIAVDLSARIIVPIAYRTDLSGDLELRTLASYLDNRTNIRWIDGSEFSLSASELPPSPMIYAFRGTP
ncbi:MAG: MBL fold metallo-hydrolase [Methylacidiphilaceae bacterium]|nr:MBL fold metallo-hydrolase [Candidatus Methylacidiphilaceae bacterium]